MAVTGEFAHAIAMETTRFLRVVNVVLDCGATSGCS